ncbi:adenylate/guanylate cyclase domain-containing protein [Spirulina subsalsa FACHB-351]|uniref:Adenylate/guanylate cyclase domain-containing protein n=1 Tax=Spirulina subsalsa FACHB-351 TaxID=234711 RepID=A0ABT3L7J5_9CYAN|nr:adenylate/guanylate cyclase domain-containing protein [Spirulina subsalsa]MCW6036925.1 adenylate/guanylate cyclase domain-containing protein [Spirulina subsalsa FACHB-351]
MKLLPPMTFLRFLLLVLAVLFIFLSFSQTNHLDKAAPTPTPLSTGWLYRWGNSPNTPENLPLWVLEPPQKDWTPLPLPQQLQPPPHTQTLWLAVSLPPGDWSFPSLYFQNIPHLLHAYFQGQLIYSYDEFAPTGELSPNEGKFPLVFLPPDFATETLYLQVHVPGKSITLGYDTLLKIGNSDQLFKALILKDSIQLTLGLLFIFCGLFPLIFALFTSTKSYYISFGWFVLLLGIYTITPTHTIRLIFNYSIFWTYIHHTAFHLIPPSLCLFFEHIFGQRRYGIVRRLWQIHLSYAPIALIFGSLGFWELAAHPTQFLGVTSALILLLLVVRTALNGNQEARIFALGFIVLMVVMIYDIITYVFFKPLSAHFQLYYWGMLFFIGCVAYLLERRFIEAQKRLKAYNLALKRFVPHEFLNFLQRESIIYVGLGDQVQEDMTVLFADIRSFTSISESMSPQKNIEFLNAYLSYVSPVIRHNGGFIDKYIGDAVMALFPRNANHALKAAIEMQFQVEEFNKMGHDKGYPRVNIGIGLHRGNLMLGTIGEQERLQTTVIADAVNLASRLEESTKQFGAKVIVSESTLLGLEECDRYLTRYLGQITVKGKKNAVRIYEVYNCDSPSLQAKKTAMRGEFEQAIAFFDQGQYIQAYAMFQQLIAQCPEDLVLHRCLQRCGLM